MTITPKSPGAGLDQHTSPPPVSAGIRTGGALSRENATFLTKGSPEDSAGSAHAGQGGEAPPIILDLPIPPSANRIWKMVKSGRTRTILSAEYQAWKKHADAFVMHAKTRGLWTVISGPFSVLIELDRERNGRGDPDNRIKPILDYCQRVGIVANDRTLEELTLRFGYAPEGCRVTVRPLASERVAT